MRLDVLDQVLHFEPDLVLVRVLEIWLSIMLFYEGRIDDRSVDVVDAVDYTHGPERPEQARHEVETQVESY